MSTFVMPGVEVTNRYEHVDTPSTHTIADELHNRNKTDSATSWLSEWCVPSVNRANDSESLFFFLFFVRQMGPSRSNHPNNHIETETRHRFTIAEFALKFLTYCALFLGKSLYPHSASLHLGVEMGTGELTEKPHEILSKGLGGGNGGRNMSRTSIQARGRIAILLVTSRYRNKNRLLLDRHLGSSTDLSLYALNKK